MLRGMRRPLVESGCRARHVQPLTVEFHSPGSQPDIEPLARDFERERLL
ncbi:hypothetical protein SAMN05216281_11184 [Cryobacterium luteum]|nr:hypothetical protein SAMN05216281_11184 [Cryobacterium luteum]